ncbi:hypothetical protein Ahy_B01g054424 [Arachis hypogaea]|uniref:Uncharacterized protein n=1 Tax=Arachis hypogaea TaxID=3818 RepID=A0A445ATU6_ARAHY|nr:hypothetical protein Ahy_B01g054424 [Arachis hypogaea]
MAIDWKLFKKEIRGKIFNSDAQSIKTTDANSKKSRARDNTKIEEVSNVRKGSTQSSEAAMKKGKEVIRSNQTKDLKKKQEDYSATLEMHKYARNWVEDDALDLGCIPGVGSKGFPNLVRELCCRYHANLICLLERHVSGVKADQFWRLIVVYGSPHLGLRSALWEGLLRIAESLQGEWCVASNFNSVLSMTNTGDKSQLSRDQQRFADCLLGCGLQYMEFQGQPFTWQRGSIRRRLDKYIANDAWS